LGRTSVCAYCSLFPKDKKNGREEQKQRLGFCFIASA
jgi:hypothetical protein